MTFLPSEDSCYVMLRGKTRNYILAHVGVRINSFWINDRLPAECGESLVCLCKKWVRWWIVLWVLKWNIVHSWSRSGRSQTFNPFGAQFPSENWGEILIHTWKVFEHSQNVIQCHPTKGGSINMKKSKSQGICLFFIQWSQFASQEKKNHLA